MDYLHQAPIRTPYTTQNSGESFLDSFTTHFAGDAHTMLAFEALFTEYNKSAIEEMDFYVGAYMLLSSTKSLHLLQGLLKVLPASWQAKDLNWLHEAAEARCEKQANFKNTDSRMKEDTSLRTFHSVVPVAVPRDFADTVDHNSSGLIEQVSPLANDPRQANKRMKRPPTNGFRTSHATAATKVQPMFIDPAALLIHKPVIDEMPDSANTSMLDQQPVRKGLVKLKLTHKSRAALSEHAASRRAPQSKPAKRNTAKGSLHKETTSVGGNNSDSVTADMQETRSQESGTRKSTSQEPATRKGRNRYGEMFAAEIDHFGHFPTRRAVIARASRPYVHLACGKGFSHPMDVKDHHRNKERVKSGAGCSGKDGIPQGDDDKWDAHPSARVEYPSLNYTKVKDGYVLLDQESRNIIDKAIAAGLEYLAEWENHNDASSSNEDEEMVSELDGIVVNETTNDTADTETDVQQSSVRSAKLGLREKSTKSLKYGA